MQDLYHDPIGANFREIRVGGIAPKTLYRSGHPIQDDKQDSEIALAAAKARIKTVLNLSDTEAQLRWIGIMVPWYKRLLDTESVIALGMNFDFMSPLFLEKLRRGILFLLDHEGPYLLHCVAGIDRTGFIAAVLGALMGATATEIAGDYMLSFINDYDDPRELYKDGLLYINSVFTKIDDSAPVNDRYLQNTAENYFLRNTGLTGDEVSLLKTKLAVSQIFS